MSKILSRIFPLFDHLYIFQNLEYQWWDFTKWFVKNPFKRNLQRKHQLEWTGKSLLLAIFSLTLILITALISTLVIFGSIWLLPLVIFLAELVSPLYLVTSHLLLFPIEYYQKQKTLSAAKNRLSELPNLKIVAIVGSFAKTSTKNMLYTLLWKDYRVVKTPKSYNTPISIARTILSDLKDNTEVFLVEMDAYHPGDIKDLCNLVSPDIGIITSIAAQHLGRFGSMEKLAKAQFELAEMLPKEGLLFLNSEDSWTIKLSADYDNKKIFYGSNGQYQATDILQINDGLKFKLIYKDQSVMVRLPLLGTHNITNFLAAAAMANRLGMGIRRISERAAKILPTPHRLEIRKQNSVTIIDNTYNTNPTSSRASFELLRDLESNQKILLTPGLVELGKKHAKENQEFAKEAARVADEIIVVGENAKQDLLKGLSLVRYPKARTHLVGSTVEGMDLLLNMARPGAIVLMENDLPDQYF